MSLIPRQPTPSLELPVIGQADFNLDQEQADAFILLVFYRGHHCPICMTYLRSLQELLPDFNSRGITVLAISSDTQARAQMTHDKIKSDQLRIAYDLSLDKAREWGLFLSAGKGKTSLGIEEPERFSEPGLFLLRADKTLYFSSVQTMPFVRPDFNAVMKSIDFVIENDYPARGELTNS